MKSSIETFDCYFSAVSHLIPNVEQHLEPGASNDQINGAKEYFGAKFPKDLVELYKSHNGESIENGIKLIAGLRFLSLGNARFLYDTYVDLDKTFNPIDTECISSKPTSKTRWIPFASDDNECMFAVDLTPVRGKGKVGQIIALEDSWNGQSAYLMADSITEFFEKMASWLSEGSLISKDDAYICEKNGHFFNSIRNYAVVPRKNSPEKIIELKDDYWRKWYSKDHISTKELAGYDEDFNIRKESVSCEPLAYVGHIGELKILWSSIRDVHYLGQNPNVEVLKIKDCTLEDGDLSFIKGCRNLEFLYISYQKSLKGLDLIGSLPQLNKFYYEGAVTDEVRSFLNSSTTIEWLILEGEGIFSDISYLYNLKELEILSLKISEDENEDELKRLLGGNKTYQPLPNITEFSYEGVLTDEIRAFILSMPNLEALYLRGHLSTDLNFLSGLTKLKELDITFDCEARVENLNFLLGLKKLTSFEMNATINDEISLVEVLKLKKLKKFCCPVNDISVYTNNPKLKEVGILGRDNVDISILVDTQCEKIHVFSTASFKETDAYMKLSHDVHKFEFTYVACKLY